MKAKKRKTAVRAAVNTKHAFKSSNRWIKRIQKG